MWNLMIIEASDSEMILLYCFVVLVSLWCWYRCINHRLYSLASKLPTPSPPPLPIIGHLYIILFGFEGFKDWLTNIFFRKGQNSHFNTFCLWLPTPHIFVSGKQDIQKVLNSSTTAGKSEKMNLISCYFGDGLTAIASGDTWKIKRRFIQQIFQQHNLEILMPAFNQNCRDIVDSMSKHAGQGQFDVRHYMMSTGFTSICNLLFGTEEKFGDEEINQMLASVTKVTETWVKRTTIPWLQYDFLFKTIYGLEVQRINNTFQNFINLHLKDRNMRTSNTNMNIIKNTSTEVTEELTNSGEETEYVTLPMVFSDMQKYNPEVLQEDSFLQEVINVLCAGTDTTSATLSAALLLLGQFQDVQEKLFNEIVSVVGYDKDVTVQDIHELTYLEQVYKETLRWASTVPVIVRKATKDIKLSSCTVMEGSDIFVSLIGLHNDPERFPDARMFDPDRFSPDQNLKLSTYEYLPFSGGPRNCIGKLYSELLDKVILIHVLRNYKISANKDVNNLKWRFAIALVCKDGYSICIEDRCNN